MGINAVFLEILVEELCEFAGASGCCLEFFVGEVGSLCVVIRVFFRGHGFRSWVAEVNRSRCSLDEFTIAWSNVSCQMRRQGGFGEFLVSFLR